MSNAWTFNVTSSLIQLSFWTIFPKKKKKCISKCQTHLSWTEPIPLPNRLTACTTLRYFRLHKTNIDIEIFPFTQTMKIATFQITSNTKKIAPCTRFAANTRKDVDDDVKISRKPPNLFVLIRVYFQTELVHPPRTSSGDGLLRGGGNGTSSTSEPSCDFESAGGVCFRSLDPVYFLKIFFFVF